MVIKVIIKEINSIDRAYEMLRDVREHGLRSDVDFKWWYKAGDVDDWLAGRELATVRFEFVDPKWESYFMLKWI